ncbi:MAG: alpha/beta fold hydrolase [Cyanobacteria bacterium P01_H01_bin.74]
MLTVTQYNASNDLQHDDFLNVGVLSATGSAQKTASEPISEPALERPRQKMLWYIPGLGGSVQTALGFLQPFLESGFDTIYGTDLRGFGLNAHCSPGQVIQQQAQDLSLFYRRVILPQTRTDQVSVTLCGISLGGLLATHLLTLNPEWFEACILLAPAYAPNPVKFTAFYRLKAILTLLLNTALLNGKNAQVTLPYTIEDITQNPDILNNPEFSNLPALAVNPRFLLSIDAFSKRLQAKLSTVSKPVYMLVPLQDKVCDPDTMQVVFQQMPQSKQNACVLEPCEHDITYEPKARQYATDALHWLSKLGAVAP